MISPSAHLTHVRQQTYSNLLPNDEVFFDAAAALQLLRPHAGPVHS
jgi:hypothetical protein